MMHVVVLQLAILALGNYLKITIKSDCSIFYSARVVCNHQLTIEPQETTNTKFKREEDMLERFTQADNVRKKSKIVVDFIASMRYYIYNAVSRILNRQLFAGPNNNQCCQTIRMMHVVVLQLAILALGNYLKITIKSDCSISPLLLMVPRKTFFSGLRVKQKEFLL